MTIDRTRASERSPRWPARMLVLSLAAALAALAGCQQAVPSPLHVVVSGDSAGWITPCGCTANQSGGFNRRATLIGQQRLVGDTLYLDVGGAVTGASEYDRVKLAAMLRGEQTMGLTAHNIGGPEAGFGPAALRQLAQETGAQLISANLLPADGSPPFDPAVVVTAGGRRVLIVGVSDPAGVSSAWQAKNPQESVLQTLTARTGQYDSLLVLAYLPDAALRALAQALPEVDLVVGGPTGQAIPPERIGPVLLASAANKGKFLASFTLNGPQWSGEIVEVKAALDEDPEQQANLQQFYGHLGRLDLAAEQTSFVAQQAGGWPAGYRVAGSQSCLACHKPDAQVWHDSKHSHAFHTLEGRGAHVDSYCQQCHTTSYGLPGGFQSRQQGVVMQGVGCENCHGPSHKHTLDPRQRTAFSGRAAETCIKCHDPENSPKFAYDAYWQKTFHGPAKKPGGLP